MRRTLITGASGFVGRRLIEALSATTLPTDQIVGISRVKPDILPDRVTFRRLDLLDQAGLSKFIKNYRPTDIIHLAAISSVQQSAHAPSETWRVNVVGLLNLADCVARFATGSTFFFVSTGEVYGRAFLAGEALSEAVSPIPLANYARSKFFGEEILRDVLGNGRGRLVILRPFNHFGPGQDERFVVSSFAGQIARIEAGLIPPVLDVGNLDARRDFLPVGDVVRAYVGLFERANTLADGSVFNIASGCPRSIESVLADLRKHTKTTFEVRVSATRVRPSDIPIASGDASYLRATIGWAPTEDWVGAVEAVLADARAKVLLSKH